jgi:hypothetical protein
MPRKKSIDRENSELLSPTASTAGQCALGRITVFEKIDQGFLVPRIPLALILVSHKSVKDRILVTAKFWQQCHALIGVLVILWLFWMLLTSLLSSRRLISLPTLQQVFVVGTLKVGDFPILDLHDSRGNCRNELSIVTDKNQGAIVLH